MINFFFFFGFPQGLLHVAKKMPKNAHAHFILGLMYQRLSQPQKVSFRSTVNLFSSLIDSICVTLVNFVLILGDSGLWEGWRDIASLRGWGSSAGFAFLSSNSPRPGLVIYFCAFRFILLCETAFVSSNSPCEVFVYFLFRWSLWCVLLNVCTVVYFAGNWWR